MLKNLIIDTAYFINTSSSYKNVKQFFSDILENSDYKYKKYFDIFMIILIFISVAILIREVKFDINHNLLFFNNYIISFIFLLEYLLRLWISSSVTQVILKQNEHDLLLGEEFQLSLALKEIVRVKLKYIFSLQAIIDLLAILPFLHQLRLLRIFVLFRVFKLFRYAKSVQTFTSIIGAKKFEFATLFIFAAIVIFMSSVVIYVIEAKHPNSSITTLFEALYWSIVTISTVGYGDISPITPEGRVVAIFVIVAGIAVFSFTTSLIVTSFTEKLDEIKELNVIENIVNTREFYLVCGYESVTKEVVKKLSLHSKVIILEEDDFKVELAKEEGFIALNYDPGSINSYEKIGIDIQTQVKAILCLGKSDVENVYTALTVRSFNKEVFILSILKTKGNKNKLKFAGVNEIVYEKELVGVMAKECIVKQVAFEALHALGSSDNSVDVDEILFDESILLNYDLIAKIDNAKYKVVILGIYENTTKKFLFNPSNSTVLKSGDYLLVIGNSQFLKAFRTYLHEVR